jgi:hypothetical protein
MGKKRDDPHSIKTYLCHPDNPCGTCFACNLAGRKEGWNTGNAGGCGITMAVPALGLIALLLRWRR